MKDDLYDLKFRHWTSIDFPWSVVQFVSREERCVCFADSLNPVNGAFPLSFRSKEIGLEVASIFISQRLESSEVVAAKLDYLGAGDTL